MILVVGSGLMLRSFAELPDPGYKPRVVQVGDAAVVGRLGTPELAGLGIAAVVVAAVFLAVGPSGANVRAAVCQSIGSILHVDLGCASVGGEDEAATPDDSDFVPEKCMVHEAGDTYSSVIKIGFVEIGENAGKLLADCRLRRQALQDSRRRDQRLAVGLAQHQVIAGLVEVPGAPAGRGPPTSRTRWAIASSSSRWSRC